MHRTLSLVPLAVTGVLSGCAGAEPDSESNTADVTSLRASPPQPTGTRNSFTVLFATGPPVSTSSSSSAFTTELTLGATYDNRAGYYASRPETIHVVMIVTTEKHFHGSLDRPKKSEFHEFDIRRQADGTYRGLLGERIRLPGHFGDSETFLESVEVAFVAENGKWDSNLGRNYHVSL